MKKILIAVDDNKGSLRAVDAFSKAFSCGTPVEVVLLHVQKIEGRSLMDEMLGKAEMSTLKEELKGTKYQKGLDRKSEAVISYFAEKLKEKGISGIREIVSEGHPADEIIRTAEQEGAELIVVGSRGERMHTLLMGSVSREVANRAGVPVLLAK